MSLKDTDTLELLDRFDYLVQRYVPLAAEIAPKIEKFGKYRRELQHIVVELQDRGVQPKDHEDLKGMIENVLIARETVKDEQKLDTTKGPRESRSDSHEPAE